MKTLPIELLVERRPALVIGGDDESRAKVERLIEAGAKVHVICERNVHPDLDGLARRGVIRLSRRAPTDEDFDGALITFFGPEHRELGTRHFEGGSSAGRLICCLDHPAACTFVNPSVTTVSGLRLTLSSGGRSPGLLRRLREDLTLALGDPRLARFIEQLGELRASLPAGQRRARLQKAVAGFRLSAALTFPSWFEAGVTPPESDLDEP